MEVFIKRDRSFPHRPIDRFRVHVGTRAVDTCPSRVYNVDAVGDLAVV